MAKTDAYFSAGADLVTRAGLAGLRYRTEDGRYILSESDIRLMANRGVITPAEYVGGLDVIEVSDDEARELISKGGYSIGKDPAEDAPATEETEDEVSDGDIGTPSDEANDEVTDEDGKEGDDGINQ